MTLQELGERTHKWKKKRSRERPLSFQLLHLHSEVSECFELLRKAEDSGAPKYDYLKQTWESKKGHPEGLAIELADVVIIASHIAHLVGVNLDEAVEIKTQYNEQKAARRRGKAKK